jgi:hypothetical protein
MTRQLAHRDNNVRHSTGSRKHAWLQALAALGIAGLAAVPASMAGAAVTPTPNLLHIGSILEPGQSLVSKDGAYRFEMARNGNLVLFRMGVAKWTSETAGHPGAFAAFQMDGNLVVVDGKKTLWKSPSYVGHGRANYIVLHNDGNVVINSVRGAGLWSINRPNTLQLGDSGSAVLALQWRLSALHYWIGPIDGFFGDSTQQAVWALEKAVGIARNGVVGNSEWIALERSVVPVPQKAGGNLIEVNLNLDLLMIIRNGQLWETLNTSTGGGYTYTDDGVTAVAITPQGTFHTYAEINGIDVDSLGTLWRPKFFTGGFAIHGDSDVPPFPASHGCVRISNEAINWVWADNVDPIGTEVLVY